jgi:hypothetical protein
LFGLLRQAVPAVDDFLQIGFMATVIAEQIGRSPGGYVYSISSVE